MTATGALSGAVALRRELDGFVGRRRDRQ